MAFPAPFSTATESFMKCRLSSEKACNLLILKFSVKIAQISTTFCNVTWIGYIRHFYFLLNCQPYGVYRMSQFRFLFKKENEGKMHQFLHRIVQISNESIWKNKGRSRRAAIIPAKVRTFCIPGSLPAILPI